MLPSAPSLPSATRPSLGRRLRQGLSLVATLCGLLFSAAGLHAQEAMNYIIENGDTLFIDNIPPAYIFNRPKNRKEKREWREYYRTVYNFAKAYPFALQARERMLSTDSLMAAQDLEGAKRERYLAKVERELFREFEAPLRRLTLSQGRMLLRLIDRELGQTTYYVVKDYRGGITAAFWQGVARLFGADMKLPYDKYGTDKELEELVQMYHDGRFYYLYSSLFGPPTDPRISPNGTGYKGTLKPVP